MGIFNNEILNSHNTYRKKHGAPPLKWSSKLQSNAQQWANALAKKGYLQHANQQEEGENIAVMKGAELTGTKATDLWYEEIKDYNFNNPGFNSKTGHFTQVVWVDSRELGVGKATSSNGMQFVVARYFPGGNMLRRFSENVLSPGSKATTNDSTTTNSSNSNKPTTTATGRSPKSSTNKKPQSGQQPDKDFRNALLKSHNQYRKRHSVAPLKWNSKLEKAATEAAQEAAKTNVLRSVELSNTGQNMAAMTGGELSGEKVSSMWYDEEKSYSYNSPGFSSSTGSFTQLVWKATTEIGVGRAFGAQGQTFVVALYQAPGNIRGKYEENVNRPSGPPPSSGDNNKQGCNCVIL